jgi:hypothetical protein
LLINFHELLDVSLILEFKLFAIVFIYLLNLLFPDLKGLVKFLEEMP